MSFRISRAGPKASIGSLNLASIDSPTEREWLRQTFICGSLRDAGGSRDTTFTVARLDREETRWDTFIHRYSRWTVNGFSQRERICGGRSWNANRACRPSSQANCNPSPCAPDRRGCGLRCGFVFRLGVAFVLGKHRNRSWVPLFLLAAVRSSAYCSA